MQFSEVANLSSEGKSRNSGEFSPIFGDGVYTINLVKGMHFFIRRLTQIVVREAVFSDWTANEGDKELLN